MASKNRKNSKTMTSGEVLDQTTSAVMCTLTRSQGVVYGPEGETVAARIERWKAIYHAGEMPESMVKRIEAIEGWTWGVPPIPLASAVMRVLTPTDPNDDSYERLRWVSAFRADLKRQGINYPGQELYANLEYEYQKWLSAQQRPWLVGDTLDCGLYVYTPSPTHEGRGTIKHTGTVEYTVLEIQDGWVSIQRETDKPIRRKIRLADCACHDRPYVFVDGHCLTLKVTDVSEAYIAAQKAWECRTIA